MTFRVWCLSWDDEEEYGSDVVGYDVLHHDYKRERRGVVYVPDYTLRDAKDAAEAYADYAHDHREGYESTWPLVFRVRCPDGTTADFEVQRDYDPTFTAAPVKVPEKTDRVREVGTYCPHCAAGEPSVWDDVLSHYAHPDHERPGKLKMCHYPWRERCRSCSADISAGARLCKRHEEQVA